MPRSGLFDLTLKFGTHECPVARVCKRFSPVGNALLELRTWKRAHAYRKVDRPLTTIYLVHVTVFEAG